MEKRSKVKEKSKIDLAPFVNADTGEYLLDELNGGSMSVSNDTGKSIVTYSDYSVISTDAAQILFEILNNSDFANVMKMALVVRTDWSILFNNTVPHTNETLQKYLKIKSEAMFMGLIRRLMKAGVLYQVKGLIWGEVRVIYLINPYLCRKRKVFENRVLDVFRKFTKDNEK